jgi:hypothetical protein
VKAHILLAALLLGCGEEGPSAAGDAAALADGGAGDGAPRPAGDGTVTPGDGAPDAAVVHGDGAPTADAAVVPGDGAPPADAGPPPIPPLLTELMARNESTLADEDGDFSDWIEVHNPTAAPLPLAGFCLTDDRAEPCKWPFPHDVSLAPGEYRVVFASGKDRDGPVLHTNFKLDGGGEDLALGTARGDVLQAFDHVPPQLADVSWGLLPAVDVETLVEPASAARAFAGEPPAGWRDPGFDDGAWVETQAALGDDRREPPAAPRLIDDAQARFSGAQGRDGWSYGYVDADGAFALLDPGAFDGSLWRTPGGTGWISAGGMHPSGVASGVVEVPVRRWTAPAAGHVRFTGVLGTETAGGDGVVAHVTVDGAEVFTRAAHGRLKRYEVEADVRAGSVVDFAVDAGPDGNDWDDDVRFTTRVEAVDAASAMPGEALADSVADWSSDGLPEARGWTYGTYAAASDADHAYAAGDFRPYPRGGGPFGADDAWDGRRYVAQDDPSGAVRTEALFARPAGGGDERWPVRRWVVPEPGRYLVRWRVAKVETWGGGVTGRVFLAGREVDRAALAPDDTLGVDRLVVVQAHAGDALDLALDPRDADGSSGADGDGSTLEMRVWAFPSAADFASAAPPGDAAFALRARFQVAAPHPGVRLRARSDEGFVATIDGEPFASADAGQAQPATFEAMRALAPGEHVLAVQVPDTGDGRRLFAPRLEALNVDYGAAAPGFLPRPTPGAANAAPAEPGEGPPAVRVDPRSPAVMPGQPVPVEAVALPGVAALAGVEAVYRVNYGPEAVVPLRDAGDGRFTGELPPQRAGDLVRFRVRATDAEGRVATAPPFEHPESDERWYGTVVADPALQTALPVMQLFVGRLDDAGTGGGTRGDVFFRGELYDNVRFDLHGQSTADFPKKSYNLSFDHAHRLLLDPDLPRQSDVDLLTNYGDKTKIRNTLAYEVYREAGGGAQVAFPVRVQLDGRFFAVYDLVENGDERFLERIGLDPDGELFKMYDDFSDARTAKVRVGADEAHLAAAIAALDAPAEARARWVMDHVDLAAMANFLAAQFVIGDEDCCHKNYYAYFDRAGTGDWWFLPWDLDLTFGHAWTPDALYFDDDLALGAELPFGSANRLVEACFDVPGFDEMYRRRLRTLLDRFVQPPGTPPDALYLEGRVAALQALLAPDADLDNAAWPQWGRPETFAGALDRLREEWLTPRRAYVYGTYTPDFGSGADLPAAQGEVRVRVEAVADPPHLRLTNLADEAVDLSGYTVSGAGVQRRLTAGTVIPGRGVLFVVGDRAAWREARGGRLELVQGNWSGVFDPAGGMPVLLPPP